IPETNHQGGTVKKLILSTGAAAVLLAAVVASALAAGTTVPKPKPIAFVGSYSGTAVTNATDNVVSIKANGTGTGTLLGAGKIVGVGSGDSSVQPCVPFTGTGNMTGPGGSIIFKVLPGSSGCGDEQGQLFTVSAKAVILKATGKLLKRKGTLRITGTFDRSSGAFSAKFRGTLVK